MKWQNQVWTYTLFDSNSLSNYSNFSNLFQPNLLNSF